MKSKQKEEVWVVLKLSLIEKAIKKLKKEKTSNSIYIPIAGRARCIEIIKDIMLYPILKKRNSNENPTD